MSENASYEEALFTLRQFMGIFQERQFVRFAKTGDGTGADVCDVDSKPGWIWVRYDEDQSKVAQVFCEIRGMPEDVPVIIGKPYPNAEHEQVLGINWPLYYQGLTNFVLDQYVLPKHGSTHSGDTGADRTPVGLRNIEPGRVRQTDPAGLSVYVESFQFEYGNVVYWWTGEATDLTTNVPGAAGHIYTLVSLDIETNTLQTTDSALVPLAVPPDLPIIPVGAIPLAYIQLQNGQTTIEEGPDLLDGRMLWDAVGGVADHTHSGVGDGGASLMCIEEIYLEDLPVTLDGAAFTAYGMYQTLYVTGFYPDGKGTLETIHPDEAYAGTCPQWIIIRPGPFGLYSTYEITVKHNVGNIRLSSGNDIVLDEQTDHLMLIYNGDYWCDIGGLAGSTQTVLLPIQTVFANYTAGLYDEVIVVDASGGNVTVTLPAVSGNNGKVYTVKRIDASANIVTVDASGGETIDDELTQTLDQYDALKIVASGEWWII